MFILCTTKNTFVLVYSFNFEYLVVKIDYDFVYFQYNGGHCIPSYLTQKLSFHMTLIIIMFSIRSVNFKYYVSVLMFTLFNENPIYIL